MSGWPRTAHLLLLAGCAVTLGGCAAGYVLRAAYEEARVLWRREPISTVLARPDLDPGTRAQLELVLAVRRYAADELGLRVGGSYTSVARVDADQIVHVVTAAPRDRLEPKTWWFPIAGRVPYRGYFERADAEAFAAALEREGYDTLVRPAVAFSTLGWFDDPVLSTMLRGDHAQLAETIVHELTHATLYVPGHASFNESFAQFVGLQGAERFFQAHGDAAHAAACAARWSDALTFSALLESVIARLSAAYAAGISAADRGALFADAQADAAHRQWLTADYAGFWRRPLNNAVLVHDRLYADRLAAFDTLLACHDGDLRAAIAAVRAARDARDPWDALRCAARAPASAAAAG